MAIFRVGSNRCPETQKLKLAYLCQKKEVAALLWRIFVSRAHLQAYVTRRQYSGIKQIFVDPKQTVLWPRRCNAPHQDAHRQSLRRQHRRRRPVEAGGGYPSREANLVLGGAAAACGTKMIYFNFTGTSLKGDRFYKQLDQTKFNLFLTDSVHLSCTLHQKRYGKEEARRQQEIATQFMRLLGNNFEE